jgi:serine/threonine-protein kinase HipA
MNRCRCCLKETKGDFCRTCSRKLFGKDRFCATLNFSLPDVAQAQDGTPQRISISGAQPKYSLKIEGKSLVPTDRHGTYILKPATSMQFRLYADMPANEHITMLMAKRIFKLNVAEFALLQFPSGEFVYLTKRYDVREDGTRIHQEDFAQVANLTSDIEGSNFKYESLSYEEIAELIKAHISASTVATEQFFRTLLFNYLVCNGDAHIKNFSIYSPQKDGVFEFAPAYDLMNTSLHTADHRMALDLFKDEDSFQTDFYKANGFYGATDFMEFARRVGIIEARAQRFVKDVVAHISEMDIMLDQSFLSDEAKRQYKESIRDRAKALDFNFSYI